MNTLPMLAIFSLLGGQVGPADPAGKKVPVLSDGVRHLRTITNPQDSPAHQLSFAGQDNELLTLSARGIHAWDVKAGTQRHAWPGNYLAFTTSADGKLLAAVDAAGAVPLFDRATRKELWRLPFSAKRKDEKDSAALAFSPDGKLLAVGFFQDVELWDLGGRKLLYRWQRDTGWEFGAVQFFPDSRRLFVTGFPTYLGSVWDVKSGQREQQVMLMKYVESARLSPDGGVVAAGVNFGSTHQLSFFPTSRDGKYRQLSTPRTTRALAFSRDGRLFAAACDGGQILLLHANSFQVAATLGTDNARHVSAAFSADGRALAVGADDGRVRLWDLAGLWDRLADYEQLTPKRLEEQWRDLLSARTEDLSPVYQLIAVPGQSVPLLAQKLKPARPPDPKSVARLLKELDSPRFADRARASQDLEALHWLAKPALQEALEKKPTLETRRRLLKLLEAVKGTGGPIGNRQYWAVVIVSEIRTPAALELLHSWATGHPDAYLTQEAQRYWKSLQGAKQLKD